ncbi:probable hexosyltransferase MUCI70 [Lolium rigidum]|uniref:probable hexosyltransferase MUCI70 n=1 Tax=Lolium rigidum TaxID=89674 RepID=UPI001F5CF4CA|nr:probable hexosyltransferase MUCI70 [Lolium rigidum]
MAQYRQSGGGFFDSRGGGAHHPLPDYHRAHPAKPSRIRRTAKPARRRSPAVAAAAAALLLLAGVFLLSRRLSRDPTEIGEDSGGGEGLPEWNRSKNWKQLKFGHGGGGRSARDSRYWDQDDRRRDEDYSEDEKEKVSGGAGKTGDAGGSTEKGDPGAEEKGLTLETGGGAEKEVAEVAEGGKGGTLYNEGGRKELEQYEAASIGAAAAGMREVDPDDEYDDGFDAQDDPDDAQMRSSDGGRKLGDGIHESVEKEENVALERQLKAGSRISDGGDTANMVQKKASGASDKKHGSKKKSKRKKSGSTCEMRFLNSTAQLVEPPKNEKFASFNLDYVEVEEKPVGSEYWEPRFGGHQSLQEREESYVAHDQKLTCAFVKGPNGTSTGFDISEDDRKYMSKCRIAVSSCIFGNSDRLRTPFGKTITSLSKKTVCFAMFLDEVTLETLLSEGQKMDSMGFIGIWKIILIKNMPYNDMRRVGKIPKLLAHRLFPSSRFSIWLDSKLRLQTDPILILEYFLWRHGYEYAISNHYDRHCVWEEVAQNKKLNKFNHTIIDQQFEFYQADGLTRFNPLDPNKLLPSYVPEGSFIVREHTPMSNLFSCLWYNEVDRFTPRDQLSFAYTYLKLRRMNPKKSFRLNMFKDCERRSIAKLFHHRSEERHSSAQLTR